MKFQKNVPAENWYIYKHWKLTREPVFFCSLAYSEGWIFHGCSWLSLDEKLKFLIKVRAAVLVEWEYLDYL